MLVSAPQRDTFLIGVNETLNRTTAPALTDAFVRALAADCRSTLSLVSAFRRTVTVRLKPDTTYDETTW